MDRLKKALGLAKLGYYVFPVIENSKFPACRFTVEATRDPDKIKNWWTRRNYNIGIYTGRFGEDKALVAVDIDNKPNKNGHESVLKLELEGKDFPDTFTQVTPTGGKHLIYVSDNPVRQGVSVLGHGVDIRSYGGYLVASGSVINGKYYLAEEKPLARAPDWMVERLTRPVEKKGNGKVEVNERTAFQRATLYLQKEAPVAVEGDGGDETTFKVAARIKDFGIDPVDCLDLLFTYWNPRCSPPWSSEELAVKVENAYRYGFNPQGADSPEADFSDVSNPVAETQKVDHPVGVLNEEFAFLTKNSEIIWETTDHKGNSDLLYLSVSEFHNHMLSKTFVDGSGKLHQLSKMWLRSPYRRSYVRTCFYPGKTPPPQFYNLWRGFSVEEKTDVPPEAHGALEKLLSHIRENICAGEEDLFNWFIGYFAHLIQRPYEKPLTCIVMKGRKGTGKNVVINCFGRLIREHAITVANRRYLTGQFNAHLEKLLLLTLDEAFWSGDKATEGILKDLVTGETHMIERKGQEAYPVDNLTRVVVIGNEDWVVPATEDERRYAVFNVGDGRRGDVNFFGALRSGMEKGGYSLLLQYLKNFDLSKVNINLIPQTEGLLDQKTASLNPIQEFWFESLRSGQVDNVSSEIPWPNEIDCGVFRDAIQKYFRDRNIRSWVPDSRAIGKELRKMCPSLKRGRKRIDGDVRFYFYEFPTLVEARLEWEQFIGHKIKWDEESDI